MKIDDEEKMTFYTDHDTFSYYKIPFGLKNARAIYQCLMDKVFADQSSRNVEVYLNDMVIKFHDEEALIHDIEETFQTMTKAQMKLNPTKYTFGVEEGQFLRYQVTNEGISPKQATIQEFPDSKTYHNLK